MRATNNRIARLEKQLNKQQQNNYSPTTAELKLRTKEVSLFFSNETAADDITPYKNPPPIDEKRADYASKIFKKYLKQGRF